MRRKILSKLIPFILSMLILALASCSVLKPGFHGKKIDPAAPSPEISLADHNGNPFQLSGMRGKIVLLFFGYVNCPDECPLTMANLAQTLELLQKDAQQVQVVLVSTDPVRDTPQAMKEFLAQFHPSFLGIPGSADDLAKIWGEYDVEVLDGGETHTSTLYVIDQNGDLRLLIDAGTTPQEIASDLSNLLAENAR